MTNEYTQYLIDIILSSINIIFIANYYFKTIGYSVGHNLIIYPKDFKFQNFLL